MFLYYVQLRGITMITINEYKLGNESYYERIIEIDDNDTTVDIIRPRAVVVSRKGQPYYLNYDSNMKVQSDAFSYINNVLSEKSVNTQIKAHVALKFLFAFEELIRKSLADFLPEDVVSLKYFLHGYNPQGQTYTLNLSTIRSNDTVNGYLSVYRSYLQYLGIENHPLFQTTGKISPLHKTDETYNAKNVAYRMNDRKSKKFIEVPKYISIDEFTQILEYVRNEKNLMAEIIIRLMFQCGLRIGEVLGLTADDLVMENASNLPRCGFSGTNNGYVPIAYIRNRVSDAKDQNAKSCMKVISKKQYQTDEYNLYNNGYQFVVVPQDLFDLIDEYIEEAHSKARETCHDRYYQRTIADRVRPSDKYEDDNYYIFINSIGTPISASTWNNTLRNIFSAVGIPVDQDKRKSNLNHRFRHGFAMFNVQYRGVNTVKLAELLRHSSLGSVMCYFQPTISDQIELKTAAIESMYEVIPDLKRSE